MALTMLMPLPWSELMKATLPLILIALLCLPVVPTANLQAQDGPSNSLFGANSQQQEDEREPAISMREASEIARQAFSGRVLSVRLEGRVWRVRMDQDGAVFDVLVDAQSGRASRASQ